MSSINIYQAVCVVWPLVHTHTHTMVCLVEAQHIMTFTLDYVFELIWVSSLFVLLFSLNLGAIIALETAAFCVYVCVCVNYVAL